MGTLFIVATPIGNVRDITVRALEILEKTEYIACEDTRHTGNLIHILQTEGAIQPNLHKFISFYDEIEPQKMRYIIEVLQQDHNVALVSDAGTPTISDPGFKLVRECIAKGVKVETIPGPSSPIAALTVSGLPTDKFLFLGYLPHKQGNRIKLLENLKQSLALIKSTVIFFEAPHKLVKTLEDVQSVFGDIELVFVKELTKVHEDVTREKISQALERYATVNPRGEFVILFNLMV